MRRKDDTLRDTLLALCRDTVEREGIEAVNIRSIAKKAGVATGTVYNYFSGKDEILLALTEDYWRAALEEMEKTVLPGSFLQQLENIFRFLRERLLHSAGALMGSLSHVETLGQERMTAMQGALADSLIQRMEEDPAIRRDIWDESFTEEQFARFILTNMMALWKAGETDFIVFLSVVSRILYD